MIPAVFVPSVQDGVLRWPAGGSNSLILFRPALAPSLAVQNPRAQAGGVDGWPYITGQAEYMRDVGRGHPTWGGELLAGTCSLRPVESIV